jgi:hypothetical protein
MMDAMIDNVLQKDTLLATINECVAGTLLIGVCAPPQLSSQ